MAKQQNFKSEGDIIINANAKSIWDVLTNPDKIKVYLFGSEAKTDWKEGSPVTFSRISNGTYYCDKGQILVFDPEKRLRFSYWSSQEGYEDIPENYSIITYTLEHENEQQIKLNYCREKIPIEFELKNQEQFLPGMLENIKKLAERDS